MDMYGEAELSVTVKWEMSQWFQVKVDVQHSLVLS